MEGDNSMTTIQKISSSQRALTEEGRMAIIREVARRAANRYYWSRRGKNIPAATDELSQWAKKWLDTKDIIQRVTKKMCSG